MINEPLSETGQIFAFEKESMKWAAVIEK